MKKDNIVLNGFTLWTRSRGKMVFARQLEPTSSLFDDGSGNAQLYTPILVGEDGECGRDLTEVLEENETLKRKLREIEEKRDRLTETEIERLKETVSSLEKPWYKKPLRR